MKQEADERFMRAAIAEARRAAAMDEVPIGAVAVHQGAIVARARNLREATGDPLGHAEMLLLQRLARQEARSRRQDGKQFRASRLVPPASGGDWRYTDVTIYVTCEPCLMCAGALLQARIPRLVFGCLDPKAGACGSLYDVTNDPRLNHRIAVTHDCLAEECGALLSDFFRRRRLAHRPRRPLSTHRSLVKFTA
ncbi:MAG: nucleoside deaminase [Deltaproteobacteria bacterium]|nr:nucleoside deaminase [Deltaproteobacteria bacterium]